jgi:hypothetical protein
MGEPSRKISAKFRGEGRRSIEAEELYFIE